MSYYSHFHHKIHSHPEIRPAFPVIDAHLHFVDFIQESDGIHRLLKTMDAADIVKAVVFGLRHPGPGDRPAGQEGPASVSIHDDYEHLHEIDEVLEEFPSTIFVAMPRYNTLLHRLDPGVRTKVAVENAEKLWFK